MTSELRLDRIEFQDIKLKVNYKAKHAMEDHAPQLRIDFDNYNLYQRSKLLYPESQMADPRHFGVIYGVKLESKNADDPMHYEVEVEALAFLHYLGDEMTGEDRFRAVRLSGYQILHGAIREMVANLTARSRHGLLQIPSRNFNGIAKKESVVDEKNRQSALNEMNVATATIETKKSKEKSKPKQAEDTGKQSPMSATRKTVQRKRAE